MLHENLKSLNQKGEKFLLLVISYALCFLLFLKKMMAQAANISIATTGTTMMMITLVVLSSFFPGLVLLSSLFPAEINRNSQTSC